MTLTGITLIAIAVLAMIGYYEFRISRLNADLAASNDIAWQWANYTTGIESELDSAINELNRISREYGTAITNWKVKYGHIPSVKIAYTDKTKQGDPITRINTQLGLFPTNEMFSDGEFKPQYDENGRIVFERVIVPDMPAIATNGNGHTSTPSSTVDNSKASASDKGSFSSNEPDYNALATKHSQTQKYVEFIGKVKSANKVESLTQNQTNYLLAKFDQWENKPNTTDDYAKRVTSDHLAKNK